MNEKEELLDEGFTQEDHELKPYHELEDTGTPVPEKRINTLILINLVFCLVLLWQFLKNEEARAFLGGGKWLVFLYVLGILPVTSIFFTVPINLIPYRGLKYEHRFFNAFLLTFIGVQIYQLVHILKAVT